MTNRPASLLHKGNQRKNKQTSRCCMVCLMQQSHISGSFEYHHISMFTLDLPTCVRNRLSAFRVVHGFYGTSCKTAGLDSLPCLCQQWRRREGGMEGGRMRGEEEGIGIDREHERYELSVLEWTSFYMHSKFLRQKLMYT